MTAQILLLMHIAFGGAALTVGGFAAFAKKGSPIHVKAGRIFAIVMFCTAFTAISLSVIRPNGFLLAIGLFTLYLTGSGWLWARRMPMSKRKAWGNYFGYFGLAAAFYMGYEAYNGGNIQIVLVVFASILFGLSAFDTFQTSLPKEPISKHGGRMGGAYIAAFTAFVVVNINLGIWGWLGPTIIGVPMIILSLKRFRQRSGARVKHDK
jgi:uncharacterized membrane protein